MKKGCHKMIKKFQCTKCGNCCKNFTGGQPQDKTEIPNIQPGGLIQLSEPTLVLYDWEKDLFPKKNIEPFWAFFDSKNEQTIIFKYTLNLNTCPFLKDGSCSIYDKRPIMCRSYPCNMNSINGQMNLDTQHGFCEGEVTATELRKILSLPKENDVTVNGKDLRQKLYERYGDSYVYSFMQEEIDKATLTVLMNLFQKGFLKFAIPGYNLNFLVRRMKNSKQVNVSEIIKQYGTIDMKTLFSTEFEKFKEQLSNRS